MNLKELITQMQTNYFHMTNNNLFDGITIFVAVLKHGSFVSAAEALGHSNSHVSKEIAKLETRLGVRLLNRTTRSISLTPEGELYYKQCLQLVSDAENAFNLVTQSDDCPRGTLKISCPIGFGLSHIQAVISDYIKRYPNVNLEWDMSDKRIDIIGEGFDLAIRAAPSLDESSLICKRVYACPMYLVAAPSYIAAHGRPYHPSELVKHNCITYSNLKNPGHWQFTDKHGQTISVDIKQRVRCNSGLGEVALLKNGVGISIIPAFYIEQALADGELEILLPEYTHPEVNVYVIYPSRKHVSPKVRRFIDMISDHFAATN